MSRHQDVEYVLKNPQVFSSTGFQALLQPAWLPHNPIGHSILAKDGLDHAKLRALQNKAFTPRAITRLEARVREFAVAGAGGAPWWTRTAWRGAIVDR